LIERKHMENRLYVGNLAFQTTESALEAAFSRFGTVSEAKLVLDRESGRSRGFAFVSMADAEGARRAIAEMNGALLDGRPLRVNEAEAKPARSGGGGGASRGGSGRTSRW
jgi:cold-inducible RNA-binding protein